MKKAILLGVAALCNGKLWLIFKRKCYSEIAVRPDIGIYLFG